MVAYAHPQPIPQARNVWILTIVTGLEAQLSLPALQCALPLTDIYTGIVFPVAPTAETDAGDRLSTP